MKNIEIHFKQGRIQNYDEKKHDPYRINKKYSDPTICSSCGSLFTKGRWTWDDLPEKAESAVCPACCRTRDNYPAGIIELKGSFFDKNEAEILNLIYHIKDTEISEHPLERLLHIYKNADKTVITTTGLHLARRIGEELFKAYKGILNSHYNDDYLVRVNWQRD